MNIIKRAATGTVPDMKMGPLNRNRDNDPLSNSAPLQISTEAKIAITDRVDPHSSIPPISTSGIPGRKILVVDGDSEVAGMVALVCATLGYQSMTATSAVEALIIAQRDNFSLFIIDYHLHPENGLVLISRLRQLGLTMPAIVMIDQPQIARFMQPAFLNIVKVLIKPFSLATLKAALDECVNQE